MRKWYQLLVFLITYCSYAVYTINRIPFSITKSMLGLPSPALGCIDGIYYFSYSIFMLLSGSIGDRVNIKKLLGFGMIINGIVVAIYGGIAKHCGLGFLIFMAGICGAAQSIGWPCNVSIMGRWFNQRGKATIFGLWNTHGFIGSILGKLIAVACISMGKWRFSYYVPGGLSIIIGIVILKFLVTCPTQIQLSDKGDLKSNMKESKKTRKAISFMDALKLPGVIQFSLCLLFCKTVYYAFLLWIPLYLENIGFSEATAGTIPIFFDVGGVLGGILAGAISDKLHGRSAMVSGVFLLICSPCIVLIGHTNIASIGYISFLLFIIGILITGPYSLIPSTVATELALRAKGDSEALATVAGIIDGTGSFGGSLQALIIGFTIEKLGWNRAFDMLGLLSLLGLLIIFDLVVSQSCSIFPFFKRSIEARHEETGNDTKSLSNLAACTGCCTKTKSNHNIC